MCCDECGLETKSQVRMNRETSEMNVSDNLYVGRMCEREVRDILDRSLWKDSDLTDWVRGGSRSLYLLGLLRILV